VALKSKGKRKTERKKTVKLTEKDFRYPNERVIYWQAIVAVMIMVVVPAIGTYLMCKSEAEENPLHNPYQIPALILLWPIISVLVINWLAARPRKKLLKTLGPQAKTTAAKFPQLRQAVSEYCKVLDVREPDIYVLENERPEVQMLANRTMFITTGLIAALTDTQLRAALAHHMAHLKGGHVRMHTAITFIRAAKPWTKAALAPAHVFAMTLGNWVDVADYSADRAAALLTGSGSDVNAMMVKLAVIGDPLSQIEPAELDEYLQETGELSTDSAQVERHFKIGNFVANVHNLRERINEAGAFLKSEQGKAAMAKLAEMKRTPAPS